MLLPKKREERRKINQGEKSAIAWEHTLYSQLTVVAVDTINHGFLNVWCIYQVLKQSYEEADFAE